MMQCIHKLPVDHEVGRSCRSAVILGGGAPPPYHRQHRDAPAVMLLEKCCLARRGRSPLVGFCGEMAEWFKAHAWKACVPKKYRGFESPSLRQRLFLLGPTSTPFVVWMLRFRIQLTILAVGDVEDWWAAVTRLTAWLELLRRRRETFA